MEEDRPAVMTVEEVAEYLRIPRGSAYKLAQKGMIPGQKVGRHWRFRREAIELWLSSGTLGGSSKTIPVRRQASFVGRERPEEE